MCLILFAHRAHPDFPLVVAANRDEFYDRPTAPASFWEDAPRLLAGRDLRRSGTWMGITREGRFAALTNFRDPHADRDRGRSRGLLVSEFLGGDEEPVAYLQRVAGEGEAYDGFNLIAGDPTGLWYLSNRAAAGGVQAIPPGVYGLSNHLLDTAWPKVERGKRELMEMLASGDPDPERVFEWLCDRSPAAEDALPDTGVGREWERALSPLFIETPTYGTRASTVLLVDREGEVTFIERTFTPEAPGWAEVRHRFRTT